VNTAPDTAATSFEQLGLAPALVEALSLLGYEEPTPIQRAALPPLLEGRDVLGMAATGTGKTAAFSLPLLQRLTPGASEPGSTSALVLVPTRELAMQVAEALQRYGQKLGVRVLPIYGGQDFAPQLRALKRGVDVVVATPGRALDHLRRGTLHLEAVRTVVLDEADEMLDMGFAEELEELLQAVPTERQTALFSATLPQRILGIAERHLREPVRVRIAKEKVEPGEVPRVRQTAYVVPRAHKQAALARVLELEQPSAALLFCRTRNEVDELTAALVGRGWRAEALHGGLNQEQRERVLKQLKARTVQLLVATDVAARGLDIEQLSHVVNYDVPSAPEAYVHRIGRTGRAGREGVAITLAELREQRLLRNIEKLTGQRLEVAPVPTVAELRVRQLERLRASLREALEAGGLEEYRQVVEGLAADYDQAAIAAAAVKLLHDTQAQGHAQDTADIPSAQAAAPKRSREAEGPRPARGSEHHDEAPARAPRAARKRSGPPQDMCWVFIGAGQRVGLRPADVVGAITGEAGVQSSEIGAIEIAETAARVEVPAALAEQIISALQQATLRGRKVTVRRFRE
jgi:ATP-dependent RNA helicase DeaD